MEDKKKAPSKALTKLKEHTSNKKIIAEGWTFEKSGYYFSSGKRKEFENILCLSRKTKFEDFLKKSSNSKLSKPQKIRGFDTGASSPMGTPIDVNAPIENHENGKSLPAISSFEDFQSMTDARSEKPSLLLGFDTEWDDASGQVLSWQFACIQGFDLVEILFISLDGKNLTLDYCLGKICDYLGLASVDLRSIRRYTYCKDFKDGEAVLSVTDSLSEAKENASYVYRDGCFTSEKISDQPDRFKKRSERDWAWFHLWYDYKSCQKIPVTLVCHTGRVDVRNFGTDEGEYLFRFCSNVQGGLVTLNYPIMRHPKSISDTNSHASKVYPIALSIRDTMGHAPAGMKSLESLGAVVGIEKIDLDSETKSHMKDLWNKSPERFLHYASRDSIVTMLYASALYGYNHEMPVTLTSASATVARKVMMKYLNCETKEEFDMKYRGLQKVSHGMTPRTDRPGYIEMSSLEPISDKVNTLLYYCSQAFHGGYNGSSFIGYFPDRITYDYDLQNAYPTSNSLVPDIDMQDPIMMEISNRKLKLTDFIINQFTGQINPLPIFVMYGTFSFPEDVKYPCLPVTIDGIPIYPRTSDGLNGAYLMGPEVVLALHLGAEVFCEKGYFMKPLLRGDGSVSYSLRAVNKQLVSDRSEAKKLLGKGCLEEQALKTMDNSIYGKNAQNVVNKSTWSAYTKEMEDLGASSITNPISAALTTSIVRAELLAVQNQCESIGYHCYSVTTDGGLFDCPEDVMKSFDLYGLRPFMAQSRLFLTDNKDPEIWEIKHAQDDLLNFCRRGNISLYSKEHPFVAPNDKEYQGVCAHNSTKSGFESDSPEDRKWLFEQVMTRTGAVKYFVDEWTGFKEQSLGEPFKVTKNVAKHVKMDFDFSRKPIRDSFYPISCDINGSSYEIACFETEPFNTISEFRKYRDKKKLTTVLRTMEDWSVFWQKIDLNSSGAKPRDMDFSIIMSIVMGYRSHKFDIPSLDACETVADKIDFINKYNDSKKLFNINNWKDARKPSRQSNMLPDEFLMDKLNEMINDER